VVVLIAFICGGIAYAFQKWLDRKELVRARHFQIHMEMVEAIGEIANSVNRSGEGKEEALSNYAIAKMKFAIVANDESMRHFIAFDRRITSGIPVSPKEYDSLLAAYMRSARSENLGRTDLSDQDLIVITPFGRSIRGESAE